MTKGELLNYLKSVPDDTELILVYKNGEKSCVCEDIIDLAPANEDCSSFYLYGDSWEGEFYYDK